MSTTPTNELTNAGRTLVEYRNKKLGPEKLKRMAYLASLEKRRIYGDDWAVRAGRGEKLVPIDQQESAPTESSEL